MTKLMIFGIFTALALSPATCAAIDDKIPHDVSLAAQCLKPETPNGGTGEFLRVKGNRPVAFRYHPGGIPNTSNDSDPYKFVTIVFYSLKGSRAVVMQAIVGSNGTLLAISDDYLLRRVKGKWETLDGQGGPGTYRRVEQFVQSLANDPIYTIPMRSTADPASCIDQSQWDTPGSKYLDGARIKK